MAKLNQAGKTNKRKLAKLLIPVNVVGVAALAALIVIINPFNIVKILKNNYPNLHI